LKAIIDTGPWVALIDRSEARHNECVQWFKNYSGVLFSTESVLTEVLYLLNFSIRAQSAALELVNKSIIEIVPSDIDSYRKVSKLMIKYADLPMDYADATLVCLGMDTGISSIVTFDKKDFSIYKISKNKHFTILP